MTPDVPQHVEHPAYIENHVLVAPANNWHLAVTTKATPVVRVPEQASVSALEYERLGPDAGGDSMTDAHVEVVHFATDSARLGPEAKKKLKRLPRDGIRYVIEGHADPRGSSKYNQGLSERRAQAAKTYLDAQGYVVTEAAGYGETRTVSGHPGDYWKDRRVEVKKAR